MKKYIFILVLLFSFLISCEEKQEIINDWDSPSLSEYEITPINGGAIISYTLPEDPQITYILAEYERSGKVYTEKSSIYNNFLTIEGFNSLDMVQAKLYKVNSREERSKPLIVEFEPLESPVKLTSKSTKIVTDFGGILTEWENPDETELGVNLMTLQENGEYETQEMYFSVNAFEKYAFRGFKDELTTFAITFADKFGNLSDTVFYTTTPYFETEVKKPYGDARALIPYDNTTNYSAKNSFPATTDGIVGNLNGWLPQSGTDGVSVTWDLKQVVKLSRMNIWAYAEVPGQVHWSMNVHQFEVWGCKEIDQSKLPPATDKAYWLHDWFVRFGAVYHGIPKDFVLPERTFKDDWEFLGYHQITIRSGQALENDLWNGHPFDLPFEAKPVRYVRFFPTSVIKNAEYPTPPANNYWSLGEISFFGDNTVPQN